MRWNGSVNWTPFSLLKCGSGFSSSDQVTIPSQISKRRAAIYAKLPLTGLSLF